MKLSEEQQAAIDFAMESREKIKTKKISALSDFIADEEIIAALCQLCHPIIPTNGEQKLKCSCGCGFFHANNSLPKTLICNKCGTFYSYETV